MFSALILTAWGSAYYHLAPDNARLVWDRFPIMIVFMALLAAVITEPMMCNNGCVLPESGFLEGLRAACDRAGCVLIFDEIITGFRVALGGAQSHFGVTPDLAIFGKAMGSGFPISALVGKRELMDVLTTGKAIQAGTMNAQNASVAAALATVSELERR